MTLELSHEAERRNQPTVFFAQVSCVWEFELDINHGTETVGGGVVFKPRKLDINPGTSIKPGAKSTISVQLLTQLIAYYRDGCCRLDTGEQLYVR